MALYMGENSYGNPIVAGSSNNIFIGKYCSISDSVMFDSGIQHNHRFVTSYPLWKIGVPENREGMCRGDIHVGSDVWIGDGAMIRSGVTIGDGAVIGARTVVTRNVSPYTVWGGAPMQFIRYRFTHSQIERLCASKWWDLPEDRIRELGSLMLSTDVEAFLREVEA